MAFYIIAHTMSITGKHFFGFIDLTDAHEIVIVPLIEVAILSNRHICLHTFHVMAGVLVQFETH